MRYFSNYLHGLEILSLSLSLNYLDAGIQDKKHEYLDSGQICVTIIELDA